MKVFSAIDGFWAFHLMFNRELLGHPEQDGEGRTQEISRHGPHGTPGRPFWNVFAAKGEKNIHMVPTNSCGGGGHNLASLLEMNKQMPARLEHTQLPYPIKLWRPSHSVLLTTLAGSSYSSPQGRIMTFMGPPSHHNNVNDEKLFLIYL